MSVTPPETIFGLISGFWIARSIHLAARPGLTVHFNDAPKTIKQLSTETETDRKLLYRLMRVLASVGIFAGVSDQCFALTPLAVTLQTDALNSLVSLN